MWGELRSWTQRWMLDGQDPQLASPADLDIPTCVATVDEAVAVIREHKRRSQIGVEK